MTQEPPAVRIQIKVYGAGKAVLKSRRNLNSLASVEEVIEWVSKLECPQQVNVTIDKGVFW
jgi:hypothetical protein